MQISNLFCELCDCDLCKKHMRFLIAKYDVKSDNNYLNVALITVPVNVARFASYLLFLLYFYFIFFGYIW